jgi:hypothetical protein
MSKLELEDRGRSLEEQFFRKEQAKQLEALRAKRERGAEIEALREASGVSDEAVLGELVDLGVSAASLTAFALMPLAYVAWANGTLEDAERDAVLRAASELGITEDSPAHGFLIDLLAARPAGTLMDHWEQFVAALRKQAGANAFSAIAGDVAGRARDVAEAAGGILGIGAVSHAESEALARIESALG